MTAVISFYTSPPNLNQPTVFLLKSLVSPSKPIIFILLTVSGILWSILSITLYLSIVTLCTPHISTAVTTDWWGVNMN